MGEPRNGPFGPEGEFGVKVDHWMDLCYEADFLAHMIHKHPEIFTEEAKELVAQKRAHAKTVAP